MFISQNHSTCKDVSGNPIKLPFYGNLVPNVWYHKLLRPCGRSDTTAIAILSELVFLHRYNGDTEFRFNFKSLAEKFNFGLSQVRDAIVRLEANNLVSRDLRTIVIQGRSFSNEMFLVLNIGNVQNITNSDPNFNFSYSNHDNSDSGNGNNFIRCLEISSDNKIKKDLKEISRSSESSFFKTRGNGSDDSISNQESKSSNFYSNSFNSKQSVTTSLSSSSESLIRSKQSICNSNSNSKAESEEDKAQLSSSLPAGHSLPTRVFDKPLSQYHPLSKEDVSTLQVKSGREFDANFVNQLLLKMSKKYPSRVFCSKAAVLSYVAKLLTFELRDAVKVSNVSNGSFTFMVNQDQEAKREEEYLAEVENSCDTSYESQLRKKIAGRFQRELAYRLLHASRFKRQGENLLTVIVANNRTLLLTKHQEEMLLSEVCSVYGNNITKLEWMTESEYDKSRLASMGSREEITNNSSNQQSSLDQDFIEDSSVWGRVRSRLVKYFSNGKYLDEA